MLEGFDLSNGAVAVLYWMFVDELYMTAVQIVEYFSNGALLLAQVGFLEGFDLSNVTVGLGAIAVLYWALKVALPNERKAYQVQLEADRAMWTKERESSQAHIEKVTAQMQAELETMRQERAEERLTTARERAEERTDQGNLMKGVLVALARAGHEVPGNSVDG